MVATFSSNIIMKKIIIICSLLIGSSFTLKGQIIDSSFVYFKTLEYHFKICDSISNYTENNNTNLIVVPTDRIFINFRDTCSGHKLTIMNYSTLIEKRLKSKKDIDFIEIEQARIIENNIIIPIIYRIAIKKWNKVIIGIYIGYEYEILFGENIDDLKIRRLPYHLE